MYNKFFHNPSLYPLMVNDTYRTSFRPMTLYGIYHKVFHIGLGPTFWVRSQKFGQFSCTSTKM